MPVWELFVVLFLILLNGFFAMSELAIVSARRVRLEQMAKGGNRGAAKALRLAEDPTGFLSTVQIGITLIGIVAGAYSGATFAGPLSELLDRIPGLARWSDPLAFVLVVVVTTYLSLIVGELVPKRLALQHAERIAAVVSGPMTMLAAVGTPIVWFLRFSTETVLRLLRVKASDQSTVTEEEVKAMIAEGTESGVFEVKERELIEGVLRFADRPVRVIMVPRRELSWLNASDSMEETLEAIRAHGHSRYPLRASEGSEDVIGVVHVRDVLALSETGRGDLFSIARQPVYVSPDMPSLQLIEQFRVTPVHMAIVVDEYGGLEGVVTPTDILTSIAGDVPDGGPGEEAEAVRRADGSWLLDAGMPVDEVAELLEVEQFGGHGYATLAGFVLERMRRIPAAGDDFTAFGWRFEVVDMDGRRIDKLLVERAEAASDTKAG
ncbi:hemolysin family protein [Amaricoccus solimangrovi]|uniref:HlyC/CorC family transporter n=1 Tax=Amaricoccus solimangrovi TaxID=2589815 RepID=A0A501WZF5_9RHOB|nr:hemolysin family protein [Amaricoccus solimangrovi]TPE53127.1 HlyC/CorC family transporter [Amaricoccus solimangrovi]